MFKKHMVILFKTKKQKITHIKFHSKYNNAKNIRGKGR
jgi:hypothetical protein